MAHTFNPSTREVETGREGIGLGRERNTRWEETGAHAIQFEDPWRQDLALFGGKNSSGWLLCFSDLSAFTP